MTSSQLGNCTNNRQDAKHRASTAYSQKTAMLLDSSATVATSSYKNVWSLKKSVRAHESCNLSKRKGSRASFGFRRQKSFHSGRLFVFFAFGEHVANRNYLDMFTEWLGIRASFRVSNSWLLVSTRFLVHSYFCKLGSLSSFINVGTPWSLRACATWDNDGRIQHSPFIVCYRNQRNSLVSSMVHLWPYGNLAIPRASGIHQSGLCDMPNRFCHLSRNWTAEEIANEDEKQKCLK